MITQAEFQGQPVYLLSSGEGQVRVAPQCGGRLLDWRVGAREVITWPANADWSLVNKVRGGNPVLFPFLARHYVDGQIGKWRDDKGVVRDLPMHGFARDTAFAVVADPDPATLRMRIEDTPETRKGYPFAFRFEVAYTLRPDSLEVEFATTNLGDSGTEPLPYYAGHHFYFAVNHAERANWKLTLPFRQTGVQGKDGAPVLGPAPGDAALDRPELIDRFQIGPLERRFSLANRREGAEIEFDLQPRETVPWYAVTTWTMAPESDFYCVEPWLGLPDAIHHGQGLRHVAPGQTEKAVCRLTYRAL